MARGFTEDEKQIIRTTLINEAKMLFAKYGFQKTSIREITKNAGIAQGTFYLFFDSKEALYFDILESEEASIKKQFRETAIFQQYEPKKAIKILLKQILQTVESNPFIRELYVGNNMENIVNKLPKHKLEHHFADDTTALTSYIAKWQEKGIIEAAAPAIISGMLRSLFMLTLHRKEIGEEVYEETMDMLTTLIVDGLVK